MSCCACQFQNPSSVESENPPQQQNRFDERSALLGDSRLQARQKNQPKKFSFFSPRDHHQLTFCERTAYGCGCQRGTKDLKKYVVNALTNQYSVIGMSFSAIVCGTAGWADSMLLMGNGLHSANCGTCCAAASAVTGASLGSAILGACATGGTISLLALRNKLSTLSKAQTQSVIKHLIEHVKQHGAVRTEGSVVTNQPRSRAAIDQAKQQQIDLLELCSHYCGEGRMRDLFNTLLRLKDDLDFPIKMTADMMDKGTECEVTTQL